MNSKTTTNNKKPNRFVTWVSNLSSYTKNKFINSVIFLLSFFIIGGTNYYIMFKMFVPTFFILDFFIIVLLVTPIFFFRRTMFDRIYLPIIIFFVAAFYATNASYHAYFGVVLSIKDLASSLQNVNQVGMHIDSVPWWIIITNICLFLVFGTAVVLYNALWKFNITPREIRLGNRRRVAFSLIMLFASAICFEFSLQMWCVSQRAKKIDNIDYVNYSPNYHFSNLGLVGYYTQEIRELLFDKGASINDIKEYLTNAQYLKDDYTGLLKGSNVMIILIETGDLCMLNEHTTPNLWKLLNGGVNCNNNSSYNHSNVSNLIAINGNNPLFTPVETSKFEVPFNLPNTLKDEYQTYFTTDIATPNDCYNTMSLSKKYGFGNYWFHNELIPEVKPWTYEEVNYTKDSIFINALTKKIKEFKQDKPFYMQYMTLHMHMDQILNKYNKPIYDEHEAEFGGKLDQWEKDGSWVNPFDATKNKEEHDRFRRYTLKTMDFDKGLGMIMDTLYGPQAPDYLKNTLLTVYGDHSWYEVCTDGHTFAQNIRKIYQKDNIKQYSTILGMYHPVLNKKFAVDHPDNKFNKPTWPTVIVPTVLDLLGAKYNPRMYQNKSLFDETYDDNEVFYSFWHNIYMNQNYSSMDGFNISHTWNDVNKKEEFMQRVRDMAWQTRIVDTIYKHNIFGKYNYNDFMPKENLI